MSMTLPLDIGHLDRKYAGWADYGGLMYPEMDTRWTSKTSRSCISKYDTLMWMFGDNLRSFMARVGSGTGTEAMGALR